jgi:hypothetical protein
LEIGVLDGRTVVREIDLQDVLIVPPEVAFDAKASTPKLAARDIREAQDKGRLECQG